MSFVCHSFVLVYYIYVLVCHPYVTCMYSYVILMSLVCGFTMNHLKTIHQKILEFLAVGIYKFQNGLPPPIMNNIFFSRQNIYNLLKFQELSTSTKNTVNFGTDTIS